MQLFVLARHGQSELNVTHRVNGDPAVSVKLTAQGETESARLGAELTAIALDLCVHTRFGRTRQTAELALQGRNVPLEVEPLLDDIYVGDLEGQTIDDYRAWKRTHTRARRLSRWREPRRRRTTLRPRIRAPARTPRAADSRRLPRNPHPLRGQRRVGLGRARRPCARHRELRPLPLRRGRARARRSGDPPQRAATCFLDRCRLCRSVHGLRLPDAVEPALHVGVHHR